MRRGRRSSRRCSRRARRSGGSFVATLFVVLSVPAARAEPPPPPDKPVADMDLDELVELRVSPFEVSTHEDAGYLATNSITATRFDAPIRELPFAIQAFTPSFIEDQAPTNLFDVVRFSPGVTYRSNDFNEGNANVAIRGFAVSATPGNVQVLRNGFHGPSVFDFTNVSRVEVVKGPASFLYGQVAPGGIVNVITKRPERERAATVGARAGAYGQYRFDVDVTGAATDTLFLRLAGAYDQDIQYWDPYDGRAWDISPSIRWQPTPDVSISAAYETYQKRETPQLMQKPGYSRQVGLVPTPADPNRAGAEPAVLPDDWNGLSNTDFRSSDVHCFDAWLDLSASDSWDLRAGYSHVQYEVDAVFTGNFGLSANDTLLQGRRVRGQTYTNRGDTFQVDAVGRLDFEHLSLRLLFGAQFVDRTFTNWAAQAPNDPALGDDPTASPLPLWYLADPSTWDREATVPRASLTENPTDRTTRYLDRSLYLGTTFGFFEDRLRVFAGWRLTATESRIRDHVTGVSTPPITGVAVTPQYGLLYELIEGLSVFGSYSESFVASTQVLRGLDGSASPAKPTKGRGFDVGLRAHLLEGKLSGTLAFFEIHNYDIVNDLAETDASGSVRIYNVQSGEQRSRGLELSSTLAPLAGWQLYLSYAYTDARIVEFTGDDAALLARDPASLDPGAQANYKAAALLHGAPLQMSAPHLLNFWTRYDVSFAWLDGLRVGGGASVVLDQTLLPDAPESLRQTYVLATAMVGYTWSWRDQRFDAEVMGKNLAGARYRPSQSTRARPREVLVTLTGTFSP